MTSATNQSTTRRGVTEQAAVAAIGSGARVPRLPNIRDKFSEFAAAAEREQLTYLGFLAELVMAECDDWGRRSAARRIRDVGFSRDKRIEEFDFDANNSVSAAVSTGLRPALGARPATRSASSATGSATPSPRKW